jgi:hypothetical protein
MQGSIFIHAKQWFDKSGGNSYFSVRVHLNGRESFRLPFQYGYGSQYETAVREFLADTEDYAGSFRELESRGIAIYSVIQDATKAETTSWGNF